MSDSGHEAVGQALLLSGVAVGALTIAQFADLIVAPLTTLMTALR